VNRAIEPSRVLRPASPAIPARFDAQQLREDFPILQQRVRGKPLVYLDNAATTQKPRSVIEAEANYYGTLNANIHRGVHTLSQKATDSYEAARERVRRFLGAERVEEIVFVRGATEAINLVAQTYGRSRLEAGDEILITEMEHHSNIVPWQMLCAQTGAVLRVAPINDAGELRLDAFESLLCARTRVVAITHLSNALGSVVPVRQLAALAHAHGAVVLVDGAQAVPHLPVDVRDLDCDFYVFSGHKLYGPTGIGVLYGRAELLEAMPPYQGGGDMIAEVSFTKTTYNKVPYKFEAGTPNIAGVIGLGAAIDYVAQHGLAAIAAHEQDLLDYATAQAQRVEGLTLVGRARERASILSFVMEGIHPHDIGTVLDTEGVAIRTGHHCAMPLMQRLGVAATARASFGLYNTRDEVDVWYRALIKVGEFFRP
jgi:cysteine desulfurase/selenocysteine lyase